MGEERQQYDEPHAPAAANLEHSPRIPPRAAPAGKRIGSLSRSAVRKYVLVVAAT
jgi:hypothetical protein